MIDALLPFAYVAGAFLDVLLIGTTTIVVFVTRPESRWIAPLSVLLSLFTWTAAAFVLLEPMDPAWLRVLSITALFPASTFCVALLLVVRPFVRTQKPVEFDLSHLPPRQTESDGLNNTSVEEEILLAKYRGSI